MNSEELFAKISAHMVKGIMFHAQMADYYDFLGLRGYKRMHEYHYFEESMMFRALHRYYINNYCKLHQKPYFFVPFQPDSFFLLYLDPHKIFRWFLLYKIHKLCNCSLYYSP